MSKVNLEPTVCNLCNSKVEYIDSSTIYGKSYGMMYQCTQCFARVSVHKGTKQAMGILADRELRELKRKCHTLFDPQWKTKLTTRGKAYGWLAKQMGIAREDCHIGFFNKEQCNKALDILYKKYRNLL